MDNMDLLYLDKDKLIFKLLELLSKTQPKQVEWLPVSIVADLKNLTSDGVRKQLQNGDFEEGFDFKYKGCRILINQGAVERIHRKRRSSNGCVL